MPVSRSAIEFLRRHGVQPTPHPSHPRFDMEQLRLNRVPLKREQLNPELQLDVPGAPPPDRGVTDPWPPPQEVFDVPQ